MDSDFSAHAASLPGLPRRESLELPGERRNRRAPPSPRRSSVAACYAPGLPQYTLRRTDSLSGLPAYPVPEQPAKRAPRQSDPEACPQALPTLPRGPQRKAGGAVALLKLSLMAFSFVFWAAGLGLLSAGLWAHLSLSGYLLLSTNHYPNAPAILLAAGVALLLWGALGCYAAVTERRRLLRAFGLFQAAALAAGAGAGLSALFYRRDIAEGFRGGLREALRTYDEHEERAEALDALQRALRCCGVDSYGDWQGTAWAREQQQALGASAGAGNGSVPASCCRRRRSCRHSPLPPPDEEAALGGIHREGCFRKVHDFISDNMFYIATTALGLAFVQVVGIVLACLLASRIRAAGAPQPGGAR